MRSGRPAIAAAARGVSAAAAAARGVSAAAAAGARPLFARLRLIDGQRATGIVQTVKRRDRGLGLGILAHLDKAEALAAARVAIVDDLRALHGPVRREQLFQRGVVDVVAQIANV